MINKALALLLALVLTLILSSCGVSAETASASSISQSVVTTQNFTDSLKRNVALDNQLTRIAPSGSVAQIILYTLAPDLLVGWSNSIPDATQPYIPEQYRDRPVFGQFYGKNVSLNMEALVAAAPQVIIDMGDIKPNMGTDLDGLTNQLGVPVIFVEATLEAMPEAYRTLGKLLDREERAEALAVYCEQTLEMATRVRESVPEEQRVSVYYGTGPDGLNCNAHGSIHAAVLEMVGARNAAVVENVSQKGGGNQVDLEQLLIWNPERLLLATGGPTALSDDPAWSQLSAVQTGQYYRIPNAPYDFLSSPPSVNRVIGVHWLAWLLYPEIYGLDFEKQMQEFYQLFYQYELTSNEVKELLQNAHPQ